MARNVPDRELEARQVWEHVVSGTKFVILVADTVAQECYCMCEDEPTLRLAIPFSRFKDWGVRGMRYVEQKKGKLPKVGDITAYPVYSLRKPYAGAAALA